MKFPLDRVVYSTPPSTVILVSTINKQGEKNVAPFGFFMPCAHNPPMVAVGVRKVITTYKNIKETKDFVVGIPTPEIVRQVWLSGNKKEATDAFEFSKLTPTKSDKIESFRIEECQVNLECKYVGEYDTTDHTIIFGKVVSTDCKEGLYDEDKGKFRLNLKPIYHVTKNKFKTGEGKEVVV